MGMKKKEKKEEVAEDWCFECYEGGLLLVCDYKHCLKSYHAKCVGKDDSSLETDDPWFCRRHSCYQCKKYSRYQCVGCPNSVCGPCFDKVHFARVKGKGLCHHCLKLALLGEEGMDVDSDGECVDFKDLDTFEGLFFDYWKKVVKEKEGLTLEDLQSADIQIKKDKNYKSGFKLKDLDNEDEFKPIASSNTDEDDDNDCNDEVDDVEGLSAKQMNKRKRPDEKKLAKNRGSKSKSRKSRSKSNIPKSKSEIVSWASNGLLDFLALVGEDTSKSSERYKIASIINRYASENKLFHPENPGKIVCDEKLRCLFGRKMVFKNKITELLELHFPEFLESSEEEEEDIEKEKEIECTPKQEKKIVTLCKKQKNSITTHKNCEEKETKRAPPSCFAFIVTENIKLVFLRRSLVEEFLKEPETFENKVIGSFVRVKMDSGAGSRRYFFQLLPVTGINRTSKDEHHSEIVLQVSTLAKDISINLLSDDNFSEEECEALRKKVKDGLIRRPTIVELEQKAKTLHEDITKHWIVKELATLQNRMDRANEKGWRREFYECSERQQLLRKPEEVSRLLRKVPSVIPDLAEDEPIAKDDVQENENNEKILQKSMISESPETPGSNGEENGNSSEEKEATKPSGTTELVQEKNIPKNEMNDIKVPTEAGVIGSSPDDNKNHSTEMRFLEVLSHESHHKAPKVEDNMLFECELFQK